MPGAALGSSTTAPAPSANRIAVPRSCQSVMRESVSEPTTRARLDSPQRTYLSAIDSAYMKPAQAVSTLKAGTPRHPRRFCSSTPQLGNTRSGVVVPKAMKSMSSGLSPAASMARRAACSARSTVVSPSAAMWRRSMPVRVRIHSSVVSTIFSSSAFVSTRCGQVRAGAGDSRVDQLVIPCACNAWAMCAVSPRRAARLAVAMARAKATPSARPWLFTTIPPRPTMQAPL